MNLSDLLSKRLIFVSGKGGVGKTSVSILLALLAAKSKKRTLICEMNSTGNVSPVFNAEPTEHKELPLAPYISTINLTPRNCFEEYVIRHIRFKTLYKAFFNNAFVTNFIDAVPGLSQILMLGKIYELEKLIKNKISSQFVYDLIIVDAPATGHGLSALEVPKVLKSAVKIGPLHKHAVNILDMLSNKAKTAFSLVTLAEEMPVCESEEYITALKERTQIGFGPIFVNAVMPQVKAVKDGKKLPKDLSIFWDYYNLAKKRSELNQSYIKEINQRFPDFEKIILPFQFHGLHAHKNFSSLIKSLQEGET